MRELVTQIEHLAQHRLVVRPPAQQELGGQLAPRAAVLREATEGHEVGVVGRDRDATVGVHRVRVDPVGGQAGQLRGSQPDGADVVADRAAEVLVQHGEPLGDLAQPGALGIAAVDPGAAEITQHAVAQPGRLRVQAVRVRRLEDLEQGAVEAAVGGDAVDLLRAVLAERANGLVGMYLVQQRGDGAGTAERDVAVVPEVQDLDGAAFGAVLQPVQNGADVGEQAVHAPGQPGGPRLAFGGQRQGFDGARCGHSAEGSQAVISRTAPAG